MTAKDYIKWCVENVQNDNRVFVDRRDIIKYGLHTTDTERRFLLEMEISLGDNICARIHLPDIDILLT